MQRRRFLSLFGTVSTASLLPGTLGRALTETRTGARKGYGQGIMIDSLGSPGTNIDSIAAPLSTAELDDVRASGLTAVNLTVGGPESYEETVRRMAYWNAEIAGHPDLFLQVRHAADIAEAKRSGRLGILYGFQDLTPIGEDLDRVDTFRNLECVFFSSPITCAI